MITILIPDTTQTSPPDEDGLLLLGEGKHPQHREDRVCNLLIRLRECGLGPSTQWHPRHTRGAEAKAPPSQVRRWALEE
jgi:hypothetical protein